PDCPLTQNTDAHPPFGHLLHASGEREEELRSLAYLIILDRGEAHWLPAVGLVVQPELVRGEEHRVAVKVAGDVAAMRLDEARQLDRAVRRDPAADREARPLEIDRQR